MVTRNVNRVFKGVADSVSAREVSFVVVAGFLGGAGLVLGQRVNDAVLPRIGFPADPNTATEYTAAIAVKVVAAWVLVMIGKMLGNPAFGGALALFPLGLAGADAISFVQSLVSGGGGTSGSRPGRVRRAPRRQSHSPQAGQGRTRRAVAAGADSYDY
jgi:hypothetical protein